MRESKKDLEYKNEKSPVQDYRDRGKRVFLVAEKECKIGQ
jgi:hypothetical protein